MKKNKKDKLFKFIFSIFLLSFVVIYFSELTGYYEYKNYEKTHLTEEQIKKFEEDVKAGKEVDLNEYLILQDNDYNNSLSKLASKLSDKISDIVENGVKSTFKFLSKLVDEWNI